MDATALDLDARIAAVQEIRWWLEDETEALGLIFQARMTALDLLNHLRALRARRTV